MTEVYYIVVVHLDGSVAGSATPPPSLHASVARRDGGRLPANAAPEHVTIGMLVYM